MPSDKKYHLHRFKPTHKWTLAFFEASGKEAENSEKMTYEEALKERDRRNNKIDGISTPGEISGESIQIDDE